ncbi:heterokaryon incompatibility [Fusarium longipes]|uniref:Heterokaryon incompatibility n=1 Tax=Fusarium longipes TaxID=694270 RepID=A0A395T8Q1_9HYPO|nr:heterokaryon incompatibility [Fusarium longipes]
MLSDNNETLNPSVHHATPRSLKQALDEHCYVCNRFWEALDAEERDLITSPSMLKGKHVSVLASTIGEQYFFLIPQKVSVSARADVQSQRLALTTGSPETLSLAKRWVKECTTCHHKCNQTVGEEPWYPTRLLTFDLNSLCIFQDQENLRDWEHEASLMGNVYAYSFCNISAADVPDCSQSIFSNRDYRTIVPQEIELEVHDKKTKNSTKRFTLFDYKFWESEVSNSLVNKRAWVLQERLLAPRILHFGRRQLIWECGEKDAAEVYPNGLPINLSTSPSSRFKQLDSFDYTHRVVVYKNRDADENSAPHLLWHRIVEQYTAASLTVPGDKLIACSGVAKKLSGIIQDDYVAGMWRQYLEGELLWMVRNTHQLQPCTRAREYRAPSWSWASIDGPVSAGEPRTRDTMVVIEDYHLDYCTSDKTGGICGGWIQLRGDLKRAVLERRGNEQDGGDNWVMVADEKKDDIFKGISANGSEAIVKLDDPEEISPEDSSKGLLFYMCARLPRGSGRNMYLLLLKLVDTKSGTFQRIGVAYARSEKVKGARLEKTSTEENLPCLRYEGGSHSIRII